ncbi:MAG: four helix bundle protein [Bacteroidales bacterium]|nr:four helix bundle protein [Bacteroidales bacterium]
MKESLLYSKSMAFAVRCVKFYKYLTDEKREYIISKQLMRSGTSIGANIREGRFAQSESDFINKLSIALKEAEETQYWIELLFNANIISDDEFKSIHDDSGEMIALLLSTIKTYKSNKNSNNN